jgi:phenylalanyl-tRNA synthetase beta chain
MTITSLMLEKFINIPKDIEIITNQKITEIESFKTSQKVSNLVVGKVLTRVDHPNSDHLNLTTVDVGGEILDIVCGASNVDSGQTVIVAKVGAVLPGNFEIKASKIRGEVSNGMICSLKELGLPDKVIPDQFKEGIYYFDHDIKPGTHAEDALQVSDFSIELSLTPNRGDLLSVLGYAYDLAAMTNQKVQLPTFEFKVSQKQNPLKVTIQTERCMEYHARVFESIQVKPSPWWLQQALIANHIRPINNVVDISNYVMLMIGTPLHMFDLSQFNSNQINVRQAKTNEEVITLDGIIRSLSEEDVIIADDDRAVAIAGVMGLENTMVTEKTQHLILEAARFSPSHVSKTSRRLNLRSDASVRFERGVGSNRLELGLNMATQLLIDLCGATLLDITASHVFIEPKDTTIEFHHEDVFSTLGLKLSLDEITNYLMRLRYQVTLKDQMFEVIVPKDRMDVTMKADIMEELGRIYGLDLIQPEPLTVTLKGGRTHAQQRRFELLNHFVHLGIQQVITYSLQKEEVVERGLKFGEDVRLLMPLSEDRKVLRQSLIPGILQAINYNQNRQQDNLWLFEMGHVFSKGLEIERLAVVIEGVWHYNNITSSTIRADFYALKALLKQIEIVLNITLELKEAKSSDVFHPYQYAAIYFNDEQIGHLGTLHPVYLKDFDLKSVYAFEIDLQPILNSHHPIVFESISKLPSVTRDIAIVMNEDMSVKLPLDIIQQTAKKWLLNVEVFDVYRGQPLEAHQKSVAIRLTMNAYDQTIDNDEMEKLMKKIQHRLSFELNITIR